jgi:hypothetical protein
MRHAMYLLPLLQSLLLVATPNPAAGQPVSWFGPLAPGHRIRVWHDDRCCRSPQTGTLVSISEDSVVFRASDAGAPRAVSRASVRFIERGYPDGNYARRGMGLGALAGFATGAALGYLTSSGCRNEDPDYCLWILGSAVYGVLGAIAGVGVGFAIGKSMPREGWERLSLPRRIGTAPAWPNQVAVRFHFRL